MGDGGPATAAAVQPQGLAINADGVLYIATSFRVRKVNPDGIITTVAGNGLQGFSGDGGPAIAARLDRTRSVALDTRGNLLLADTGNNRIRRVNPEGLIVTMAGTGLSGFGGDNGPALAATFAFGTDTSLTVAPDGRIYLADEGNNRVRTISSVLPGLSTAYGIPSADATALYRFDTAGRHLDTLHALTGATLLSFGYDPQGRLMTITDGDGLVTIIERDAQGNSTAIVAPFGQRTMLAADANGYLARATNPMGEAYEMTYTVAGLLTAFRDPRGHTSTLTYDADGRLLQDQNAATGSQSLTRTTLADGAVVAVLTALGRITSHSQRTLTAGDRERVLNLPDGTTLTHLEKPNGTMTSTEADGTVTTLVEGPDPRFSMLAPVSQRLTVATTGGLTSTLTSQRTVTLADASDPLSLTAMTETTTVNNRSFTRSYSAASQTFTSTSAANRPNTARIDVLGRTTQAQVAGLLALDSTYDTDGRLATLTQGTGAEERLVTFAYNPQGYLERVTDPLLREVRYEYDLAGRVTQQSLPDGRAILFGYDARGNLTSLTPPGRPAHLFAYTPVDLTGSYVPPNVGAGTNSTLYSYNLDKQLTRVLRPDGLMLDYSYDTAGRLSQLTVPEGVYRYDYDPTTGKRTTITVPDGGTLRTTYTGALRTQTQWNGAVAGRVGYGYDNDFRVTVLTVNGANSIALQYDADSLLTSAGTLTLSRDSQNGLLTGTILGSVTDIYVYNGFGEVTAYEAQYGATSLLGFAYDRDPLGRIAQKREMRNGVTRIFDYGYDLAGRLSEVRRDGILLSRYTYDANGNRTHVNGSMIAHYDDQDRLLDYAGAIYTYTANGELQSKTVGASVTSYAYDVLGNLRHVTLPGGTTIDYLVDGQQRRIGKQVNGVLVQGFLWQSQLQPVAELNGSGTVVSRFVYADGVNVPEYMIKGSVTYRILKDHLGSPRLVVDAATNTVAQEMAYDEWGNVLLDTNPGFQPFGFAGGIYDQDTGLMRFGARDYEAEVGRFLSKDPIGLDSGDVNLYRYAFNNPLSTTDPLGLQSEVALLQILFPASTAPFSRNPIGGSPETQIQYANSINSMRGAATATVGVPLAATTLGVCLAPLGAGINTFSLNVAAGYEAGIFGSTELGQSAANIAMFGVGFGLSQVPGGSMIAQAGSGFAVGTMASNLLTVTKTVVSDIKGSN